MIKATNNLNIGYNYIGCNLEIWDSTKNAARPAITKKQNLNPQVSLENTKELKYRCTYK